MYISDTKIHFINFTSSVWTSIQVHSKIFIVTIEFGNQQKEHQRQWYKQTIFHQHKAIWCQNCKWWCRLLWTWCNMRKRQNAISECSYFVCACIYEYGNIMKKIGEKITPCINQTSCCFGRINAILFFVLFCCIIF